MTQRGLNRFLKLYDETEYVNACKIGKFKILCNGKQYEWNSAMLVYGFMRKIHPHLKQTITYDLDQLCFHFFYAESMESLVKRRNIANNADDIHKVDQLERLILFEACNNPNNIQYHSKIIHSLLSLWESEKIEEHKDYLIECIRDCIKIDNPQILQLFLSRTGLNYISHRDRSLEQQFEMFEFINYSAKYGSINCIELLFDCRNDWKYQQKVNCLLFAVKYNYNNHKLYTLIFNQLTKINNISFEFDEIIQECIRNDVVDVVKMIMDNKWHRLQRKDVIHAEMLKGRCFELFQQRQPGFYDKYIKHEINLDEWGNNQDIQSDFDEDGDDEWDKEDDETESEYEDDWEYEDDDVNGSEVEEVEEGYKD